MISVIMALGPLWRALGSGLMTACAAYAVATPEIILCPITEAAFTAAFPTWMASRHLNKNKEQDEKTKRNSDLDDLIG